jgi:hypothetical protein
MSKLRHMSARLLTPAADLTVGAAGGSHGLGCAEKISSSNCNIERGHLVSSAHPTKTHYAIATNVELLEMLQSAYRKRQLLKLIVAQNQNVQLADLE